jgi:hypothetical protein
MDSVATKPQLDERAMFFPNRDGKRLFAVLYRPHFRAESDWGVVLCHPRGEEKQKSYRAYVKFSRALAGAGIVSLRFDCYGLGDSEGEIRDATIESQIADTRDAMQLLRAQCGVQRFVLVGARIAALTASGAADVAALVLVAPVVSGGTYWDEVLQAQQLACVARGVKPKKKMEMLSELSSSGYLEIDADYLSAACAEQLAAIDLEIAAESINAPCAITAVTGAQAAQTQAAALLDALRRNGVPVAAWPDEPRDFWSNEALYDGYCPSSLYQRTIAWLRELEL